MDRIVSLPKTKTGHTAILVVLDKLAKMDHFAPCNNESTARDLASEYYCSVWRLHGVPLRMTTDRGFDFVNKFSAALCELVGTVHSKPTAYHPHSDSQNERMNRVLEDMLRHYVNPKQDTGTSCFLLLSLQSTMHSKKAFRTRHFTSTMAGTPGCQAIWLWVSNPTKTLLPMTS